MLLSALVVAAGCLGLARSARAGANPGDPIVAAPGQTLLEGIAQPTGVAVDGAGDVFVITTQQYPLLEEPHDAALRPVALAVSFPGGLAVNGPGDVFVSDVNNNSVVELPKGGPQRTLAFSALSSPGAVAVDGAGDVFVIDSGHARVVRLAPGGTQTTVPFSGLNRPVGLAVDASGNVFVADATNLKVYELTTGGTQTTLAFGNLVQPHSVAVDGAGSVFVSDLAGSGVVTRLAHNGTLATVAFSGPTNLADGIAVDGTGAVFLADSFDNQVVEVTSAGESSIPPIAPRDPSAVAVDGAGNVFVADRGNNRVLELPKGGSVLVLPISGLNFPSGVAVDAAGDVFVGDARNNRVVELPQGGTQATVPFTGLGGPGSVAVDAGGDVFVLDTATRVVELAKDGTQTTLALTGLASRGGLAVDAGGDVWVADYDNNRVVELPHGGAQSIVAVSLHHPTAVAVDPSGNVFELGDANIPTCGPAAMGVVELPKGGTETALGCTRLRFANGLAVDGANNVVVSDGGDNRVVAVPISQARLVNPANFQPDVDTTKPFTWSTVPTAQAFYLVVGTTFNGSDLVNSGPLSPTQTSYPVPALPTGKQLFATLFTMTNGAWTSWETINFRAEPGDATITSPTAGQQGFDTTTRFAWSTIPAGQAYYLVVGTSHFGADLVNSGILPATQSSFPAPALPTGATLYATLLTKVNGAWTRYQEVTFTAAPGLATFTYPTDGQSAVDSTKPFTWSTIPGAEGYDLVVGTTHFGTDLVSSGILPATQSSFTVPTLPTGRTLYATLLTKTNGAWTRYQAITFVAK